MPNAQVVTEGVSSSCLRFELQTSCVSLQRADIEKYKLQQHIGWVILTILNSMSCPHFFYITVRNWGFTSVMCQFLC